MDRLVSLLHLHKICELIGLKNSLEEEVQETPCYFFFPQQPDPPSNHNPDSNGSTAMQKPPEVPAMEPQH